MLTIQADITVAVPVYNQEKYIKQCIESTYKNKCQIEVIVLDDGSTDRTLEVIKSITTPENIRLVIMKQENTGNMGFNMHKLYSQASGRYISEIGSDDYYVPGALDLLKETMDRLPKEVGFIYSGYIAMKTINGEDQVNQANIVPHLGNTYYDWINNPQARLLQNNFVTPPCLLRAELYNLVKYDVEQESCEDYLFKLELSRITKFYKLPGPLSVVRIRSTSISNNPNAKKEMKPWEERARNKVREKYGM